MQAIVIDAFEEPGSQREVPVPTLGPSDVLVKITVAGINPVDWKIRAGQAGQKTFPLTLGNDFAGVVQRVGSDVTRIAPGDRIFGCARVHGSYAEMTVLGDADPASPFLQTPETIDDRTAAALPIPSLTALASLDVLGVTKDREVLIIGAAGAVGATAVQLAHARGARVVAAVMPGQAHTVRDFGADLVVESKDDLAASMQRVHAEAFSLILDLVSDAARIKEHEALYARGGTFVTTNHAADEAWFAQRGIDAVNLTMNQTPASSPEGLRTLIEHVIRGTLKVPIAGERPLADAPMTLDQMQAHRLSGKFVLRVAASP